jgi:hypothetical protein
MKRVLIKITKIAELENAIYPHNIKTGREFSGLASETGPVEGECFSVGSFRTSTVREILSPNTFRTCNGVYEWSTE